MSQNWDKAESLTLTEHPPVTVADPVREVEVLDPHGTVTEAGATTVQIGAGVEKLTVDVWLGVTTTLIDLG